jgi:hypothetical protein
MVLKPLKAMICIQFSRSYEGTSEQTRIHTHRQYTESRTEQTKQQREQLAENLAGRHWRLILCGVVTATFRVLSLFVVTCYSYSKTESYIINYNSDCWISDKLTHQSKPASEVTNTRDNIVTLSVCTSIMSQRHMATWRYNVIQFHLQQ